MAGREGLLPVGTWFLSSSFSVTLLSSTSSSSTHIHTHTHTHTHTHSHTHWTFLCRNLLQMFSFHISGNSWFHGPHQSQKAPIYKPESRRGWQRSCLDSIPLPTIEKRWITTGVYLTCSHTRLLNPQYNLVLLLEKKRESMGKKWKPK